MHSVAQIKFHVIIHANTHVFYFYFLDISLSIDIFFKFLAQVHMRPKAHPVCLKAQRFVVILSAHNKRRVFTDSKDVLG